MAPTEILDPAPRNYPDLIALLRRSSRYADRPPVFEDDVPMREWLLGEALGGDDLLFLFEEFLWRLIADGLPLDRASLHVGTLHPQLYGFAWNWERADGLCDEVKVLEKVVASDAYQKNPLFRVIEHGETFRARLEEPETAVRYPLTRDLAAKGYTDYVSQPLRAGGRYHNAITFATKSPGGFGADHLRQVEDILPLFALHVERHIALQLAGNIATTYLGKAAGERVLHGSIKRGDGLPIDAVIWMSDLRGSTDLSDRLDPAVMTSVLNRYFDGLVGAVEAEGGEVLKFIGDGLLAVFAFDHFASKEAAADAALSAAKKGLEAVARLNAAAAGDWDHETPWEPLRTGIGLHEGRVFFGNIGGAERLDFTVIGQAVNIASRVETLTKSLKRPILLSGAVAQLIENPLESLGNQTLRGLGDPMEIFAPADD